jgi:hypothetical protein
MITVNKRNRFESSREKQIRFTGRTRNKATKG